MKYIVAVMLSLVALGAMASGDYETVFVPEGKKLILVHEMFKGCVVVKGLKFHVPEFEPTNTSIPEECRRDKLVISPSTEPAYCAEFYD